MVTLELGVGASPVDWTESKWFLLEPGSFYRDQGLEPLYHPYTDSVLNFSCYVRMGMDQDIMDVRFI